MAVKSRALEKPEEAKPGRDGKPENLFSKEQLLRAERFQGRKDIMNALLEPGKQYTMKQAEKMMEDYMKGKVE